jgi:hypothetical protein
MRVDRDWHTVIAHRVTLHEKFGVNHMFIKPADNYGRLLHD